MFTNDTNWEIARKGFDVYFHQYFFNNNLLRNPFNLSRKMAHVPSHVYKHIIFLLNKTDELEKRKASITAERLEEVTKQFDELKGRLLEP